MATLLKVVIFAGFFITYISSVPDSLRLVSVLYRHGDRSPAKIYPKDVHQVENTWRDGLGWLTNIGKQQQFELGQFLKLRYDGFINTTYYNHSEILVQSSAENRCLMSAYSNLAGLFPPHSAQVWNPDLLWQPIPVQTMPMTMDNKLAEDAPCPKYDKLFQEILNSPAIKKEEQANKEFYDMVEANTGVKKESINDIWQIVDTIVCERAHNLTSNDWVYKPGVMEKLDQLGDLGFEILYDTTELARLKGGPLLKEVITNMQSATKTEKPIPKFHMYSAHDTTVASLLSAMHAYDYKKPIYRACVMVELHEIDNQNIVKVLYRNDTTVEPYELIPKGCSDPCTLSEFIEVTKDTVPVDWHSECQLHSTQNSSSLKNNSNLTAASWVALFIAVALILTIVVAVIVMVLRMKRKEVLYSRLPL